MKYLLRPVALAAFLVSGVGILVSCDKVTELTDKVGELLDSEDSGEYDSEVSVVGEQEGKAIIAEETRMVLLEFYSDTWGPCKQVAPVLERLAERNAEKVKIIKVDVSAEPQWAARENIRGVPTFQVFSGGQKMKEITGAPPEHQLQKIIDHYAAKSEPASAGSGETKNPGAGGVDEKEKPAPEPSIKPMPKDWLPPGISRKKEQP